MYINFLADKVLGFPQLNIFLECLSFFTITVGAPGQRDDINELCDLYYYVVLYPSFSLLSFYGMMEGIHGQPYGGKYAV